VNGSRRIGDPSAPRNSIRGPGHPLLDSWQAVNNAQYRFGFAADLNTFTKVPSFLIPLRFAANYRMGNVM
jgi:hypothetical protein